MASVSHFVSPVYLLTMELGRILQHMGFVGKGLGFCV